MFGQSNVAIVLLIANCLCQDDLEKIIKDYPQVANAINDPNGFKYAVCKDCTDRVVAEQISKMRNCCLEVFPPAKQLIKARHDNVGDPDKCVQQAKAMSIELIKSDIPAIRIFIQKCYIGMGMLDVDYSDCKQNGPDFDFDKFVK